MRAATLLVLALLLAGCTGGDAPPRAGAPLPGKGTAFGTLVAAAREGDSWNVTLDALAVDCERNATRWTGLVRAETLPPAGAQVGVRAGEATRWASLPDYAEACAPAHVGDVRPVGFQAPSGLPARPLALQQKGIPIALGEATQVVAQTEQLQDLPLDVEARNLTVRVSALPHGGAVVCDVAPGNATRTVPPRTTWNLTLTIACPEDAPLPPGRLAGVYGTLAFTDELGHRHERTGALWQFLAPGRAATLAVDAPTHARAPEDLVVRARYHDADGAPIRGAQVRAWLAWPNATLPAAPLREEGDAYAFRVDDLGAARPAGWPPGEREILVEAEDPAGGHVWRAARVLVRYG